jgi:Trp operon repressor
MPQVSKNPLSPKIEKRVFSVFISSIKNAKSNQDVLDLLNDLLTPTERIMISKRLSVAFLLVEGKYTMRGISKILKVSLGTVAKTQATLTLQGKGYRKTINRMLRKKALKAILHELAEVITPVPPKGVNKAAWYRKRRSSRIRRKEPLTT